LRRGIDSGRLWGIRFPFGAGLNKGRVRKDGGCGERRRGSEEILLL
jgi:hypothetical protein